MANTFQTQALIQRQEDQISQLCRTKQSNEAMQDTLTKQLLLMEQSLTQSSLKLDSEYSH